jgi:hypothetical protein
MRRGIQRALPVTHEHPQPPGSSEPGGGKGAEGGGLGGDPSVASCGGAADQGGRAGDGISKNTVKAALASNGPPGYRRRLAGSIVDAVEPQIRELLRSIRRCQPFPASDSAPPDQGETARHDLGGRHASVQSQRHATGAQVIGRAATGRGEPVIGECTRPRRDA